MSIGHYNNWKWSAGGLSASAAIQPCNDATFKNLALEFFARNLFQVIVGIPPKLTGRAVTLLGNGISRFGALDQDEQNSILKAKQRRTERQQKHLTCSWKAELQNIETYQALRGLRWNRSHKIFQHSRFSSTRTLTNPQTLNNHQKCVASTLQDSCLSASPKRKQKLEKTFNFVDQWKGPAVAFQMEWRIMRVNSLLDTGRIRFTNPALKVVLKPIFWNHQKALFGPKTTSVLWPSST